MKRYHGTHSKFLQLFLNGNIAPTVGGGEFGQGFYVGNLAHQAWAWAWNRHGKDAGVMEFEIDDSAFLALTLKWINRQSGKRLWKKLKQQGATKSFRFGVDAVWGPLLGGNLSNMYQIKFEEQAKSFINKVTKRIL